MLNPILCMRYWKIERVEGQARIFDEVYLEYFTSLSNLKWKIVSISVQTKNPYSLCQNYSCKILLALWKIRVKASVWLIVINLQFYMITMDFM